MSRPRIMRTAVAILALAMSASCGDTRPIPAQETLDHHVHVDLSQTWTATPWDPERDAKGAPLPQPEQTEISTRFILPDDLVGHGSVLVLEGLSWTAEVTVNGHTLSPVQGGPGPTKVALGPHLKAGENAIKIEVTGPGKSPALLVGHTEPEAMIRTPPSLVLRPRHGLEGVTASLTAEGVRLTASTRGIADGSSVQFDAWRDGERIADWGTALVTGDQALLEGMPWTGTLWPESGALFMLRATLRDAAGQVVDSGAWRTGLRRFELRDGVTQLNGQPHRLLGLRKHNAGFNHGLRILGAAGLNLVEFHGEMPSAAELSLADELGVALAVLPRCDGRIRTQREAVLAAEADLARQDTSMIAQVAHAPSVLLWSTEGSAVNREGYSVGRPLIKNMRSDPIERLVAAWDIPAFAIPSTGPDHTLTERQARAEVAENSPFWVLEVHLTGDTPSVEALADTVQASIDVGAVGGVLPGAIERDPTWSPAWAKAAPALGVDPLSMEGRRAPARIEAHGISPAEMVSVRVPGGPHLATIAGPIAPITLSAWHAGSASVRTPQGEQTVALKPGRWTNISWSGHPSRIDSAP